MHNIQFFTGKKKIKTRPTKLIFFLNRCSSIEIYTDHVQRSPLKGLHIMKTNFFISKLLLVCPVKSEG